MITPIYEDILIMERNMQSYLGISPLKKKKARFGALGSLKFEYKSISINT